SFSLNPVTTSNPQHNSHHHHQHHLKFNNTTTATIAKSIPTNPNPHNPLTDSRNPVIDFHNPTTDSSIPQPSNHRDPHLNLDHKRCGPPQTLISTNKHPLPRQSPQTNTLCADLRETGRDRERREQTHPSPTLPSPLPPITSSMSSAPPPVLKFSKLSFSVPEPEDLLLCGALEFYDRSFDRITPKNVCSFSLNPVTTSNPQHNSHHHHHQHHLKFNNTTTATIAKSIPTNPNPHNPLTDSCNPVIDFHNPTTDSSIPQPSNHRDPHLNLDHKRCGPPQMLISTNKHPPPRRSPQTHTLYADLRETGRDRERREQTHPSPALPSPLPPITSSMSSAPPPVLKFSKLSFSVPEPEDLLLCGALKFYNRSFDRITPKNVW
ncbi:eukaryotic translation initiation factor 3 subunit d, partial [Quercus suber]